MPYNHNRRWKITQVDSSEEMAGQIVKHSWCLCVGFRCDGILWLNDSISEDGAQEWAVVREATGEQCESITVGWATEKDDIADVVKTQKRFSNLGCKPMFGEGSRLADKALDHEDRCMLCA